MNEEQAIKMLTLLESIDKTLAETLANQKASEAKLDSIFNVSEKTPENPLKNFFDQRLVGGEGHSPF